MNKLTYPMETIFYINNQVYEMTISKLANHQKIEVKDLQSWLWEQDSIVGQNADWIAPDTSKTSSKQNNTKVKFKPKLN